LRETQVGEEMANDEGWGVLTLRVPSAYIRSDRATPEGCRRTSGSSLATLPNR